MKIVNLFSRLSVEVTICIEYKIVIRIYTILSNKMARFLIIYTKLKSTINNNNNNKLDYKYTTVVHNYCMCNILEKVLLFT